ncbi:MAG: hypothetical protein M1814_001497 [Vezdaea aestivalis]|nr:MAG: hypothetical protein M1814_001497 [Vezdaea aestivalis]
MSRIDGPSVTPSWPWRTLSTCDISIIGFLSRGFLYGLSKPEVHGLDRFLGILDQREDIAGRSRGLITVSNHVSIIDDPLIWGFLPLKYLFNADNMRWSLGSHDLCFTNKATSTFFGLGQVLPTHRLAHSDFGGLFQPTVTECIRLLSRGPFQVSHSRPYSEAEPSSWRGMMDPFSSGHLVYSTNGTDYHHAPSMFSNRRHSWIHVFPEGRVHQHPDKTMRYFKWGVSRMLLEAEPMPRLVPIWIDGSQNVMHESRTFPRFVPRAMQHIKVVFGEEVDVEHIFGDLRRKWQKLVEASQDTVPSNNELGVVTSRKLMSGPEATELRMECTRRVRQEVLKVRRSTGLPDEDPKEGWLDTWWEEGRGKNKGKMKDDSWIGDTQNPCIMSMSVCRT